MAPFPQIITPPGNVEEAQDLFDKIRLLLDNAQGAPHIPSATSRHSSGSLLVGSAKHFEDRVQEAVATERGQRLLSDAALIVPTSGTTSDRPSLVVLSTRALAFAAQQTHDALRGPGRWVIALPLSHIAGIQMLVRCAVAKTRPVFPASWPTFDPRLFARAIQNVAHAHPDGSVNPRPLYASLVSAQLEAILRSESWVVDAVSRLDAVLVGGGRIDQALLEEARQRGIMAHTTYGMTETCGGCVYDGKPLPGTAIFIAPEGSTRDQPGQILLRTPALMSGYLDENDPFENVSGARYFRTSDLGYVLSDRLHVTGRGDDVIKSGGVKINLSAVAKSIESNPEVSQVHCLGLDDPTWGQTVAAVVVPTVVLEGQHALADLAASIRETVRRDLGAPQMPRTVVVTDTLPRTSISKVHTARVKEILEEAIRFGIAWQR